ncbi:hypothetical protein [uncultured Cyclobacterium sp.]|uniref:hypothetical protein n=1 Tax=uncultured Cyclobacterium sp. TaxID=453820 RepID=UPI0030ECB637|tara:strand:- start:47300 stop:47917 length:618 start_codon:yes stop_codon:yes gene_type:complete
MGFFNKLFGIEKVAQKELIIKKERICSHDNLKSEIFERYILVKGENLKSVESKLKDYGELPAKGNSYTYQFSKAQVGDWSIIKMPSDFQDYYGFHNIAYWFLGFPPEDNNYADLTIGLSVSDSLSYAIYNNYNLKNVLGLEDELFGVFDNDEKFVLSIPFDAFKKSDNKYIKTFNNLFKDIEIDLDLIKNKSLDFEEFGILFNEK